MAAEPVPPDIGLVDLNTVAAGPDHFVKLQNCSIRRLVLSNERGPHEHQLCELKLNVSEFHSMRSLWTGIARWGLDL